MTSLVLALTSAVAYGTSDFFGGLAARRVAALRVLVVSYPLSAVAMTVVAVTAGSGWAPGTPTVTALLWGAASGVSMAVAAWTFFLALAIGPISITSPITALMGASIPLVVGLSLGERPPTSSLAGVGVALVAVLLVSLAAHDETAASHPFTRQVAIWTFTAGAAFAGSYVFTGQIAPGTGLWPLVAARWVATAFLLLVALSRGTARPATGRALGYATVVGVLDAIAHLSMLWAFQAGLLSIASVVISMFPAVTVVLAVAVLRERMTGIQICGMALGAVAIVLIGM